MGVSAVTKDIALRRRWPRNRAPSVVRFITGETPTALNGSARPRTRKKPPNVAVAEDPGSSKHPGTVQVIRPEGTAMIASTGQQRRAGTAEIRRTRETLPASVGLWDSWAVPGSAHWCLLPTAVAPSVADPSPAGWQSSGEGQCGYPSAGARRTRSAGSRATIRRTGSGSVPMAASMRSPCRRRPWVGPRNRFRVSASGALQWTP